MNPDVLNLVISYLAADDVLHYYEIDPNLVRSAPQIVHLLDELRSETSSLAALNRRFGDRSKRKAVIELIGADRLKVPEGTTLLHSAVQTGLLEFIADDLEACDRLNRTPLYYAIQLRRTAMALELIRRGAKCSTPMLHLAVACRCDPLLIDSLITAGVDINAKDGQGHTALHVAAWTNDARAAEILIRAGADLHLKRSSCRGTPASHQRWVQSIAIQASSSL